jgi:hypothetical protein
VARRELEQFRCFNLVTPSAQLYRELFAWFEPCIEMGTGGQ